MPRKDAFRLATERYLAFVERARTHGTWDTYRRVLRQIHAAVKETGTTTYITRWTLEDIQRILAARSHLLPGTRLLEITVLRQLLTHAGNGVIEKAISSGELRLPRSSRVNVRWYGEKTLALVRGSCRSEETYLMLVLASELGLRRSEIAKLRLSDVRGDVLIVRGKGEKDVPIPLTRPVAEDIDRYLIRRTKMVRECLRRGAVRIPDELLIYRRGVELRPYSPKSVTDKIGEAGKTVGIHLSPHDCRRSCGREIYLATRDILAVNCLLRHAKIDQTIQYVGAGLEDARRAMEARDAKKALTAPLEKMPVIVRP